MMNQPTTPIRSAKIGSNQATLYLGQIEFSKPFQDRISNQSRKEPMIVQTPNNRGLSPISRGGPVDPIRISILTPTREGYPGQQENPLNHSLVASNLQSVYPTIAQGRTQNLTAIINPPIKVKSNGAINGNYQVQKGRSITPDVIFARNR